ncbi:hypothetical protein EV378_5146 [Pseudonocardia endophytica]|uniref:Uncharacterized protein n=1 Tax=Pseudonocardia endophytica TaxID=401976 RepID=A0A4R1HG95_PSEEN|nr:hypothetical protein EV378_5146 [Pseudonocardia endophytica]
MGAMSTGMRPTPMRPTPMRLTRTPPTRDAADPGRERPRRIGLADGGCVEAGSAHHTGGVDVAPANDLAEPTRQTGRPTTLGP